MNILIVGNVTKDIYLNLDKLSNAFETDKNGTKWLDFSFDASEHHFFNRNCSLGGAAISLEVFQKMGLESKISDQSAFSFDNDSSLANVSANTYRYILIAENGVSYLAPSNFKFTTFDPPSESYDYLYIDRSANLNQEAVNQIQAYLDISPNTKLVIYLKDNNNLHLNQLKNRASLIFVEKPTSISEKPYAPESAPIDPAKIIYLSEKNLSYLDLNEPIFVHRINMLTHLSTYSIAAATILSSFILGFPVEESLKLARANLENCKLNSTLTLTKLQELSSSFKPDNELELIAANLVLPGKGILAADESGGSIAKKFAKLNIPDTYENRRAYRDIFLSLPTLSQYVNGVILFDETTQQSSSNGTNFINLLISKRIIPGIKVDQGLECFPNSSETYTKGLDDLSSRLQKYYAKGLRFAKWRAAFEINLDQDTVITPSATAIDENCRILTEYAQKCQQAGLVPIVEPEVVFAGNYSIETCADVTGQILDTLFKFLSDAGVNLKATILKTNMILAGQDYLTPSSPEEVGARTASVIKNHVPENLAGVVFLSGGQTPEQATANLAAIVKNGPFPWPVTFSFARALQDPALYAWQGNTQNIKTAQTAFLDRLIKNQAAIK